VALLLKLVITPTLIAVATLVGRRFGPAFAGWLVGFPFTSAPVSAFLTVEQGAPFAASAAIGSIASCVAQSAFALAYTLARGRGWIWATAAGTVAFAVVGALLRAIDPSLLLTTALAVVSLVAVLRLLPGRAAVDRTRSPAPAWDIPARATIATAIVVGITTGAPLLGPVASGIVSGFPVYAAVLAVFAQRSSGPEAAASVMRGLVAGLFGFASFFVVIALGLVPLGAVATFALATLTVIAVQTVSLVGLRGRRARPVPDPRVRPAL
jgi:hypothetical protein